MLNPSEGNTVTSATRSISFGNLFVKYFASRMSMKSGYYTKSTIGIPNLTLNVGSERREYSYERNKIDFFWKFICEILRFKDVNEKWLLYQVDHRDSEFDIKCWIRAKGIQLRAQQDRFLLEIYLRNTSLQGCQ